MFNLFGNLINSITLPPTTLVKQVTSNSSSFVVTHLSTEPSPPAYHLTHYTPSLEIMKLVRVGNSAKLIPICSHFSNNNFYLLSRRESVFLSSLPFLHVYDKSLNLLSKLGQSLKPDAKFFVANDASALFVNSGKLFLVSEKTAISCQISIVELSSGACLKVVRVPFAFDKFYIVESCLLLFMKRNWLVCFDLTAEKVKYRTDMDELNQDVDVQAYCLTKQGFIVTLDKNRICVY